MNRKKKGVMYDSHPHIIDHLHSLQHITDNIRERLFEDIEPGAK